MFGLPHSGPARTAGLAAAASLLVAGIALLASGCSESMGAPGVGQSAQTTDALALLPADADVLGMMNLRAARESDAMDAVLGEAGLGMVSDRGSSDFDEFMRMTGFDPKADLDRVFLAATDGKDGDDRAAFVAYGRFDRERIERYLAQQAESGLTATEIDGVPVYLAEEEVGPRAGFALVNGEMVLAGDEPTLTAMIGRLGRTETSISGDLQALLDRVEYPDGAWFVARNLGTHAAEIPADAPQPALAARAADGVVVSMNFEQDGVPVRAFLVTQANANTDDVADVLRGGISAAKIGLKDEPAALDVLDRVEVDAEGTGVRVEAFLTGDFLASARQP